MDKVGEKIEESKINSALNGANTTVRIRTVNTTETYRGRCQDGACAYDYAMRFERGPRRGIDAREQKAVRKIFSQLRDCRSLLDVPSGAGRFLRNLAGEKRAVIEMDSALEMLQFAMDRAVKAGIESSFIQGDASRLPLPNASVDGVFSNRLLHHITSAGERAIFLREFHRVSRRYLVVSFFDYRAFGKLRIFLKRLKGRKVNYNGQPTLEEFRTEVTSAGFRVRSFVPTGGPWVSQKYFVLEKV